jgi:Protein of unknown function (DUF3305)
MSRPMPLVRLPVGVVVERRNAKSPWVDHVWRAVAALPGVPDVAPWSVLESGAAATAIYAGAAEVGLYRSETAMYRDNLASGAPALWVVLRPTEIDPPYDIVTVTADPSEGEGYTAAGCDLVEPVPMPESVREAVAAFVAEHHVEETFFRRKRERADPDALARRAPGTPNDPVSKGAVSDRRDAKDREP